MLYKNTRSLVRSPEGDTSFFDITAGVLQGDTLAPLIFIICLDYVLRKAIDEKLDLGFTLIQRRSIRHPAKKISDADYADDIALLTDYIKDAEATLHSVENLAKVIGLFVNATKTKFICLNQNAARGIKSLNGETIDQENHLSNAELYGNIPRVTATIRQQRLRFAGHCWRSKNELSSEVLLWEPSHGKRSRGRPRKTYVDLLIADTACTYEDLANLMDDRNRWKELINESQARST